MIEKTTLQDAFKTACSKHAQLHVIILSGRSDKSAAFHAFFGAFLNLYLLTINHAKLRDFKDSNETKLVDSIQQWFDSAKTHKDATRGMELFKEFNIALGHEGIL